MNAPAKISRVSASVRYRGQDLRVSSGRARCQTPGTVWEADQPRPMSMRRFVVSYLIALPIICALLLAALLVTPR